MHSSSLDSIGMKDSLVTVSVGDPNFCKIIENIILLHNEKTIFVIKICIITTKFTNHFSGFSLKFTIELVELPRFKAFEPDKNL